jgi:hypothetical protein
MYSGRDDSNGLRRRTRVQCAGRGTLHTCDRYAPGCEGMSELKMSRVMRH